MKFAKLFMVNGGDSVVATLRIGQMGKGKMLLKKKVSNNPTDVANLFSLVNDISSAMNLYVIKDIR
jgi:hypothetical protein